MGNFTGEFVSLPRRKPEPKRYYCDLCGQKRLARDVREIGRDEFGVLYHCRFCECADNQSDGALHHACERWGRR